MTELSRAPQPYSSFGETINRTDKRASARGAGLPPARPQRQHLEEKL